VKNIYWGHIVLWLIIPIVAFVLILRYVFSAHLYLNLENMQSCVYHYDYVDDTDGIRRHVAVQLSPEDFESLTALMDGYRICLFSEALDDFPSRYGDDYYLEFSNARGKTMRIYIHFMYSGQLRIGEGLLCYLLEFESNDRDAFFSLLEKYHLDGYICAT